MPAVRYPGEKRVHRTNYPATFEVDAVLPADVDGAPRAGRDYTKVRPSAGNRLVWQTRFDSTVTFADTAGSVRQGTTGPRQGNNSHLV
jgi:hypothetical protein